jgi:PIN domain nuclease of toxin-antitoxin system
MLHLDTNAVIFLYMDELTRFTRKGRGLIQFEPLFISPMVLMELQYLFETNKIFVKPETIFSTLGENLDLKLSKNAFIDIIDSSSAINWTRDTFDRIIVANAMLQKAPLLTKDQLILEHYKLAVW